MQSDSAVIEPIDDDQKIIAELFGGLSLAPYGIFLLLSAYAFAQGWLNWKTNGGPPYLGGLLAWLIDGLIRQYYRKKYNFAFTANQSESNKKSKTGLHTIIGAVWVMGLLVAWVIDANIHFGIRFMPLLFGILVCLRGLNWLQKKWLGPGLLHVILGAVPITISIMPLILGISSNNQYFGMDGIYELSAMGIVIIVVSVMEHLIFLNVQDSDFG